MSDTRGKSGERSLSSWEAYLDLLALLEDGAVYFRTPSVEVLVRDRLLQVLGRSDGCCTVCAEAVTSRRVFVCESCDPVIGFPNLQRRLSEKCEKVSSSDGDYYTDRQEMIDQINEECK